MWKNFLLLSSLVQVISIVQAKHLPSFIPKCSATSPGLKDCILNSVNTLKPHLLKGIPEMNLPSIDPFFVPEINLDQKTVNGEFSMLLKNLNIHGLSKYQIKDLKLEAGPKNFNSIFSMDFGKVDLDCDYKLNAKFLLIPIKGHGKFLANVSSLMAEATINFDVIEKNDVKYLKNSGLDVKLTFGKNNILRFENLQQQNKVIAEATDRLLVENDDEVLDEVRPAIQDVCKEFIRKISTNILEQFPYDELFEK